MGFWERYRLKPVWRAEYRDRFFEQAGRNLLFAFILSISLNPFYVLFLSDKDTLNYVVVENNFDYGGVIYPSTFTPLQQEVVDKYRIINKEEVARIKEFETRISWLIITALLGWCVTSPRFMKGWPKLVQRFKNA